MLEFFRRHRGAFLTTLTVIIILSFSVWGGWRKSGMAGSRGAPDDVAFTIYGKDYSHIEMQRLESYQRLGYMLQMYELAFGLASAAEQLKTTDRGGPNYDFVGNLLVLREKAVEYGVAASDAEARKKLQSLPPLQKEGKFDEATAAGVEKNLGMYGFTADDMLQIAKDQIAYEKLQDIVGSNYSASPLAVTKTYASTQQTIKASTILFALDDFKKKAEVKDDEIAKYYGQKKDTYKTPEKRAAAYVLFEKPKADEKKKAEENAKAQADLEKAAGDFDTDFIKPGADIAALVAKYKKILPGLKLETLPLFERGTPPAQIKDESKVVAEIFRGSLKAGSNSDHVEGTKGYYFCKVTQVEEPKQQELKDVKDKIKEVLVTQKAQEAMSKATNDARTAINDALKAGKKLDDVLKEKSLKAEALPEFSPNNPPPNNPQGAAIAKAASETPAGSIAKTKDPISSDKGELLVIVTAKELRKRDDSATLKTSEETSLAGRGRSDLFHSWFGGLRSAAMMKPVLR